MLATLIIAAVAGIGVGVLSGMLGIGGGAVIVPLLRLGFGLSAIGSTATSLFAIIPTSLSGSITRIRNKTCVPSMGIAMGVAGACASPLGAWCANQSPAWLVMAAVAAAIAYSGFTTLGKAIRMPRDPNRARSAEGAAPVQAELPPLPSFTPAKLAQGAAIGLFAGFASGYIGLGGGFLMVPLMMSLLGMPMRYASGTSLVAVMILALPGAVTQCVLGNVDYLIGIAIACGSVPGALFGARLSNRIPERALRFAFAVVLIVAAILLVVNEVA